MTQTTQSTINITRVLSSTVSTSYVEAELHLEIVNPDGSVKWLDGNEVTFEIVNSTATVLVDLSGYSQLIQALLSGTVLIEGAGGYISCTVSLPTVGKYKINVYQGILGQNYTKLGTARVNKTIDATTASF